METTFRVSRKLFSAKLNQKTLFAKWNWTHFIASRVSHVLVKLQNWASVRLLRFDVVRILNTSHRKKKKKKKRHKNGNICRCTQVKFWKCNKISNLMKFLTHFSWKLSATFVVCLHGFPSTWSTISCKSFWRAPFKSSTDLPCDWLPAPAPMAVWDKMFDWLAANSSASLWVHIPLSTSARVWGCRWKPALRENSAQGSTENSYLYFCKIRTKRNKQVYQVGLCMI